MTRIVTLTISVLLVGCGSFKRGRPVDVDPSGYVSLEHWRFRPFVPEIIIKDQERKRWGSKGKQAHFDDEARKLSRVTDEEVVIGKFAIRQLYFFDLVRPIWLQITLMRDIETVPEHERANDVAMISTLRRLIEKKAKAIPNYRRNGLVDQVDAEIIDLKTLVSNRLFPLRHSRDRGFETEHGIRYFEWLRSTLTGVALPPVAQP